MFDPRTLAGGNVSFNLGAMALWVSLLADILTTAFGIWNYGMVEGNPLIAWYIDREEKGDTTPVIVSAFVSLALVFLLVGVADATGFDSTVGSIVPWVLFAVDAYFPIHNWLLILKLKKAQKK